MSIETDAQTDLALNPEDAENVVGGKKKKAAPKKVVQKTAARPGTISAAPPATAIEKSYAEGDDCERTYDTD